MYKKRDRGGRASYGRNLIKSHLPRLLSAYCFQPCFSWRIPIYFYNSKMSFFCVRTFLSHKLPCFCSLSVAFLLKLSQWLFSDYAANRKHIFIKWNYTWAFFDDNWVVTCHGFKFILQHLKIYNSVTERCNK